MSVPKENLPFAVCVCSLLDTCGFVTVDIKAKLPSYSFLSSSQVVFACLHVFSAGWESVFPPLRLLHPRTGELTQIKGLSVCVTKQCQDKDICRPSIRSIWFFFLSFFAAQPTLFCSFALFFLPLFGNKKKKTLFSSASSLNDVFHIYGEFYVFQICTKHPSLHAVSLSV